MASPLILFIILVLFVWQSGLTWAFFRAVQTYKTLTQGIDKKDVATILTELKKHGKLTDKQLNHLNEVIININHRLQTHIQKLGFVRYNPFGDTGGDQSFCLCLLDERNSGILITSLHTRQQTRIYTKQIHLGKDLADVELSKEETACIKKAQSWSRI